MARTRNRARNRREEQADYPAADPTENLLLEISSAGISGWAGPPPELPTAQAPPRGIAFPAAALPTGPATPPAARGEEADLSPDGQLAEETVGLRIIGSSYLLASVVLIGLIVYLVPGVVKYLTEIPEASKQALETIRDYRKGNVNEPPVSALPLDTVLGLEYESMMLRIEGIQAALGFVAGVIFVPAGLVLFAAGVTGGFRFGGRVASNELWLVSSAPGLLLVLIGGILIGLATTKDVRRTFDFHSQLGVPQQQIGSTDAEMKQSEGSKEAPEPSVEGGGN